MTPPNALQPPAPQTFVYKLADGCEIKADVFGLEPGSRRPAVIWIHGGGLIFGTRANPRPGLIAALLAAGAAVISIDHRLAPETKLPDIFDDVRDAWRWVHEQGASLLGVEPSRTAMAGSSAGGYLSLMSGFALKPRPLALVSFFGFGDITLDWEARPSAYYRQFPLVSTEAAFRAVGQSAISEPSADQDRSEFYLYCRQHGRWLEHVVGRDPEREPRWFDAYCPVRNVSAAFPPTLLIHGTEDTDVPADESRNMAAALARAGVQHELLLLSGVGHGFAGAAPEQVATTELRAAEFLMAQLG